MTWTCDACDRTRSEDERERSHCDGINRYCRSCWSNAEKLDRQAEMERDRDNAQYALAQANETIAALRAENERLRNNPDNSDDERRANIRLIADAPRILAELVETRGERDRYDYLLGNILARIHGDGGHYQGEHGAKKATEDADLAVCKLRRERDKYREALEKIADTTKWVPDSRYEGAQHGDDHSIGYMDAASDAEAMADRALTGEEDERLRNNPDKETPNG